MLVPAELMAAQGMGGTSVAEATQAAIEAAGIPAAAAQETGERVADPRNLGFADGLRYWTLRGSFLHHADHLHDYTCSARRRAPPN